MKRRVAIIGGGLAGIATAVRLAGSEFTPIVIETRQRLGGRATSLLDPRSGRVIDNCQHVLMGCCTNLIDLYERLGVLDDIQWHRRLFWTADGETIDVTKPGWLPAPAHLSGSLRRMRALEKADKNAIARAMWRMIRMGEKGRFTWRRRVFSEFLTEQRQTPGAIERFWRPIIVSACNIDVDRVDAAVALHVMQDGFLANRWSYTMGLSVAPLSALYDPADEYLREHGGEIRLGCSARAIGYDGKRVTGVVTADGMIEASMVVSAVPFDRLDKLVSDSMRRVDPRLARLNEFEVSPILGVHLLFADPIMDLPHLTVLDHGIQWIFNKGIDAEGTQHLHVVVSAADEWMELSEEEIGRRVVDDIHRVLPKSVGLEPTDVRAIKEKRATFAATPESTDLRPPTVAGTVGLGGGGIRNLFLAGDWCDTGWPATMEGAVRSGYMAAEAISGKGGLVGDVPPGLLSRLLGL